MEAFLIKKKRYLLAHLGCVWFCPGHNAEPVSLSSLSRGLTQNQVELCVASSFSVSFSTLKTLLTITKQQEQVLWGCGDVAKWIEHTRPSV